MVESANFSVVDGDVVVVGVSNKCIQNFTKAQQQLRSSPSQLRLGMSFRF